ncbi:MAG: tape measure protein, partial [Myxococcales bacterium]|nr:tape measure protein [Myxococcales bacterium]
MAAGVGIREVLQAADAYTNLGNRTRVFAKDSADAAASLDGVIDVAFNARTSLEAVAETFQRFSLVGRTAGKSTEELLRITETLAKATTVSGTTTQEAAGALRQLAQAYGANRLSGQEFNSVAEQTPIIARAIADELGIGTDQLRAFANQGKITREVMDRAFSRLGELVDSLFSRIGVTFGQAFLNFGTAITVFIGRLNAASGAGSGFTSALQSVSRSILSVARDTEKMNTVLQVAEGLFIAIAVTAIPAVVAGLQKLIELARGASILRAAFAALSGPIGIAAAALGVLVGLFVAFRDTGLKLGDVNTTLGDLASAAGSKLVDAFQRAWEWLTNLLGPLKGPIIDGGIANMKALADATFVFIGAIVLAVKHLGILFGRVASGLVETATAFSDISSRLADLDFSGAAEVAADAFSRGFGDSVGPTLTEEIEGLAATGLGGAIDSLFASLGGTGVAQLAGLKTQVASVSSSFDGIKEPLVAAKALVDSYAASVAVLNEQLAKGGINQEEFNSLNADLAQRFNVAAFQLPVNTGEDKPGPPPVDPKELAAREKLLESFRQLRGELDPAVELLNKYADRNKILSDVLTKFPDKAEEVAAAQALVNEEFNKAVKELPKESKEITALRESIAQLSGELDPASEIAATYADRLREIGKATEAGIISQSQAADLVRQSTEAFTEAQAEIQRQNAQLALESATGFDSIGAGFTLAAQDLTANIQSQSEIIKDGFLDAFDVAGQAFKDFVETGKIDIRSLGSEILAVAAKAIAKLAVLVGAEQLERACGRRRSRGAPSAAFATSLLGS